MSLLPSSRDMPHFDRIDFDPSLWESLLDKTPDDPTSRQSSATTNRVAQEFFPQETTTTTSAGSKRPASPCKTQTRSDPNQSNEWPDWIDEIDPAALETSTTPPQPVDLASSQQIPNIPINKFWQKSRNIVRCDNTSWTNRLSTITFQQYNAITKKLIFTSSKETFELPPKQLKYFPAPQPKQTETSMAASQENLFLLREEGTNLFRLALIKRNSGGDSSFLLFIEFDEFRKNRSLGSQTPLDCLPLPPDILATLTPEEIVSTFSTLSKYKVLKKKTIQKITTLFKEKIGLDLVFRKSIVSKRNEEEDVVLATEFNLIL